MLDRLKVALIYAEVDRVHAATRKYKHLRATQGPEKADAWAYREERRMVRRLRLLNLIT